MLFRSRFDTDSKTILSDFTFGTSGALQIGTYENGVSGDIRISSNGILGRNKNGDTTFSINGTTGDATFGGTLVAASGTFGTVTAGILSGVEISGSTITGGTIQTASTGQRVEIASSNNTLIFYDSSNRPVAQLGGGDYIGTALRVDLYSDITTGVLVSSSQANAIGFTYANSGNYRSVGANIQLTGATNTGTGVNINHDGSGGEGLRIDTSAGARPLQISNTGNGINIYSMGNGTNSDLFIFHDNINAMTPSVDIFSNSQGANIKLSKNSYGNPIGIDFNINSLSGGFAYMARFNGAEVASSAVSGTQNKKIRVLVGTSIYYIPLYGA